MSIREEIKILLIKEKTTLTELAKEMSQRTKSNYTMRSLSQKLMRETLRVDEYRMIVDILGYQLILKRKND